MSYSNYSSTECEFFFLVAVPEVPDLVPMLICLVGYLSVVPCVREVPKFSELFGYKFQGSEQSIRDHLVPSPSCSGRVRNCQVPSS